MNEISIYNKEYIEKMNELYTKMEEHEEIKEVKEKGNFYNISYEGLLNNFVHATVVK